MYCVVLTNHSEEKHTWYNKFPIGTCFFLSSINFTKEAQCIYFIPSNIINLSEFQLYHHVSRETIGFYLELEHCLIRETTHFPCTSLSAATCLIKSELID